MTIANRLVLSFGAVIVLIVVLGVYSLIQVGEVRSATETIVARDLAMIRNLFIVADAQAETRSIREDGMRAAMAVRLGRADADVAEIVTRWRRQSEQTAAALARAIALAEEYRTLATSPERARSWARIGELLNQASTELRGLYTASQRQFEAMAQGNLDAALAQEASLSGHRAEFARLMDQSRAVIDEVVAAGQQGVDAVYEQSRLSTLFVLVLAVAAGIVITVLLRNSIVRPLQAFMDFVERVGHGDLGGQAAATGPDEVGRLGVNLNRMVDGLTLLARQSREATANLNAAAAEIRASTQEQAASVEEQLAAVQETAATVDEITHAGAQVTKRAQEVIASAQATANTSSEGLRAVDETARVMDAIHEQADAVAQNIVALSEKTQAIGEIIATVNDISERSHLLALNAAIEAAAAGENGRSFAVVAAEMKLLADQAKDATNQVRSILSDVQRGINASVMLAEEAMKRVAAGKDRTGTTQRTIGEITARIQESVQTFQQIVASTNQQQLGIEQVMGALQNIRQASQQTAAGTRQLDEAAGNLAGLAQQLLVLAERYRV
ncbi:MAG: methyl-accepting chemotaxis protein [Alphaproteobacteria bacterium]